MTARNDTPADAAAWLIRLEGQTTPRMWDEFQEWLEADRRHEAAFIRLRTAWTHLRPPQAAAAGRNGRVDRNLLSPIAG